ncbi:MAG: N-formylglutamate deformylase [Myxococcota bacterium]
MRNEPFYVRKPTAPEVPLLVSIPHTGTEVPPSISSRFASRDIEMLPDTDWHLHQLYEFVPSLGARTICARYSRYVIDLNRPPDSTPLYPGRQETGLVPTATFHGVPIYRAGAEPTADEIAERRRECWEPYHAALTEELQRIKAKWGYALLFDAHSITSVVPSVWDGPLPGLMLGDVDGTSAAPEISDAVYAVHQQSGFTFQKNRPYKGGYITRHFGRPSENVHALQLEMSQRLYMDEGLPFRYRTDLAEKLIPTLAATLRAFIESGARRHGGAR